MTTITRFAAALTALSLLAGGSAAFAEDGHGHSHGDIAGLARLAQSQSRELYNEIRAHMRSSPHYSDLLSDAAAINRTAGHIRSVAASYGSRRHLDNDIHELEELVAHVEEHVSDARHDGHGSRGGYWTHTRRPDTRHIREAVRDLEETVDDLTHAVHRLDTDYEVRRPVYVDPYSGGGYHGSGVSFGSGGFTVRIGR